MQITFDPAKDAINRANHGLSLALARDLEWETAYVWADGRFAYDEIRLSGLVLKGVRLYYLAFTESDDCYRIISLRHATNREKKIYVSHD